MNTIEKRILFKSTPQKIWAILIDVEKTPFWVDGVRESKRTGGETEGVGLAWTEKCVLGLQQVEIENEFTEWDEEVFAAIRSTLPMGGVLDRIINIEEIPEGISVSVRIDWEWNIADMMIGKEKIRHMLEKSLDKTLQNWKKRSEEL